MNFIISLSLLLFLVLDDASAYTFRLDEKGQPDKWNDAEVETFLFLSQIQNKTGLTSNSNLCIEVSQPVAGGTQTMRIVSKITNNKNGNGMFEVGKAEVSQDHAQKDLDTIGNIVKLSSGYQQAIMNYSDSDTEPQKYTSEQLKDYMSAEVIGYTDGLGINGTVSAVEGPATKWTGSNGKSYSTNYTSNQQLGNLRAIYLSDKLDLNNSFGKVEQISKTSETELKNQTKEVKECSTRRTAEVRLNFQTSSKVGNNATWVMPTKMMSEKAQQTMQFEAGLQIHSALKELNDDVLFNQIPGPSPTPDPKAKTNSKNKNDKVVVEDVKEFSPEYRALCGSMLEALKTSASGDVDRCRFVEQKNIVLKATPPCHFACGGTIGDIYANIGSGAYGGEFGWKAFSENMITIIPPKDLTYEAQHKDEPGYAPKYLPKVKFSKQLAESIYNSKEVRTSLASLNNTRNSKKEAFIKKKFPNCAKEPYLSDLLGDPKSNQKGLVEQVSRVSSTDYTRVIRADGSINYNAISPDHSLIQAAYLEKDGGMSGRLLRCMDMSRAMNEIYRESDCKPGESFGTVTFPHKNAKLGCRYCGFGWSTKAGVATFQERSYSSLADTDPRKTRTYNTTDGHNHVDHPTFEALQGPGIHEIGDCPNCQCSDKNKKFKKIFQVEKASNDNIVSSGVNKDSCYCSTPIVPSCAVGPGGSVKGEDILKLSQKYFFDACEGKFVKASGDAKAKQIENLLNQFNKGCGVDPSKCATSNIKSAVGAVNAMMCETQKYKLPSDDPIADCTKEDGVVAQ